MQPSSSETAGGEVTRLLRAARGGDRDALDRVIPLLYDDVRAIARRQLRRELGDRTMHATALVHDAYVKLSHGTAFTADDRAHIAQVMASRTDGRSTVMKAVAPRRSYCPHRASGVPPIRIGKPNDFVTPSTGCSISITMCLARVYGSSSACAWSRIGPTGTPAARSASTHSSKVGDRNPALDRWPPRLPR